MKKLLFSAYDMNVGGIETSLLTLLNHLVNQDYAITLVLEKEQGTFLENLDNRIKIIRYTPNNHKNILIRKGINFIKRMLFILQHYHHYDCAVAYSTYSKMASFTARMASSNSVLWGHADYLALFKNDEKKVKEFFEQLQYYKFQHIIFVSRAACKSFISIFPKESEKVGFCNNLIDYKKIEDLSRESITLKKDAYTFVNIGRHDELQKKLTRIIEATKLLKDEEFNFKVWLIGDGLDNAYYQEFVRQNQLETHIEFLGMQTNPYPYLKKADCVILSSDYEGYPVVFLESFVLGKPIITTNVSDAKQDIENKYGIVVEKSSEAIKEAMKEFMLHSYQIKEKFEAIEYNKQIIENLESIF